MKRMWMGIAAGLLVAAVLWVSPALAPTLTVAYNEIAQTATALKTFSAGIVAHAYTDSTAASGEQHAFTGSGATGLTSAGTFPVTSYFVDWTMANPDTGPTGIDNGGLGTCATGVHRAYVSWLNQSGETGLSPASADVTIAGGPDFMLITRPTPPAGATHWRGWWSSFADSHAAKKSCSPTNVGAGISAIATTTLNCTCSATGIAEVSNTTGAVDLVKFLDGEMRFIQIAATGAGTAWGTSGYAPLVEDVNRVYTDGTWMQVSSDSGTTKGHVAVEPDNTLLVCPTGCEYDTPGDAMTCIQNGSASCPAPSSSNRYMVKARAGRYDVDVIHQQDYTALIGEGANITRIFDESGKAWDMNCGTCTDLRVSGFTMEGYASVDTGSNWLIFDHNRIEASTSGTAAAFSYTGATAATKNVLFEANYVLGQSIGWSYGAQSDVLLNLVSRDNEIVVNANTTGLSAAVGFRGSSQMPTMISIGDTIEVTTDQAGLEATGVLVGFHASLNPTRTIFYNTRIKVSQTNGAATADVYGIRVENDATPASGQQVIFVNPIIDVSSASASGNVRGISSENTSANLSVIVIGGTVTTSGGASAVDVVSNARLFTSGLRYSTASGTEQPYASRVGSFTAQLLGRVGDLVAATCTDNEIALDTGGATDEICICTGGAWSCASVTTVTGPTD